MRGLAAAHRLDRVDAEVPGIRRDRDHRQALVLVLPLGRAADDENVAGNAGVGAEHLLAANDEAAVEPLRRGGERAHVGAPLGPGLRDRLPPAAGDATEEVPLLLL